MDSMDSFATFHDLKDASVFISGGGSGIGASLSEGFLAQGANVAFVQRSDASKFLDEMQERYGRKPLYMPCDITDIPALQECCKKAAQEHGPIGVLINNAANDTRHAIKDVDVDFFDNCIATNLRHHFFTAQAVIDGMIALGGGSIINFSSISYLNRTRGIPVYASSKAAITGLTRVLARELGQHNIRVNALLPGWVLTERQKRLWATPEALSAHMQNQSLPENLSPADIVHGTLFLASKASAKMTGQMLVIDGGVV